jgi:uncharacterized membrane protein
LHIFCAIVGFGAVYLNAIYDVEAKKRPGRESLAVFEANYRASMIGEYFIYAVFVLGLGLVGLSDKAWKFSQIWVWLSAVLYVVGIGLSHGVLFPAVRRMGALMREMVAASPPPAGAAVGGDGATGQESRRDGCHAQRAHGRDPRPHGVEARGVAHGRRVGNDHLEEAQSGRVRLLNFGYWNQEARDLRRA